MEPSPLFTLEDFRVEDSIGYLLKRARTQLSNGVDDALSALGLGITHAQGGLLFMLSTGKYRNATDLVRELGIDAASTKRMIDRLVRQGLILRVPSAHDRRAIDLHLTAAGSELAQRLPAIYVAVLNQNFRGFSPEEVGFLRSLLHKLVANANPDGQKFN